MPYEIDLIAHIDLDELNEWTNGLPGDTDWHGLERSFKTAMDRWLMGSGARVVDVEWAELPYKAPNPNPSPTITMCSEMRAGVRCTSPGVFQLHGAMLCSWHTPNVPARG